MKSTGKIYLITGKNDGDEMWYYVNVDKLKEPIFKKDLQSKAIENASKYGEILYFGFGNIPPSYITEKINMDYGSNN